MCTWTGVEQAGLYRRCHVCALDQGAPIHPVKATLGYGTVASTGRYLQPHPEARSSRYLGRSGVQIPRPAR